MDKDKFLSMTKYQKRRYNLINTALLIINCQHSTLYVPFELVDLAGGIAGRG